MNRLSRLGIVLLIAVTLATPSAFANSPSAAVPFWSSIVDTVPAESCARFWSFLTSLWAKNGCEVDPNGRCLPGLTSVPAGGKNGCQVDPSGRCLPRPSYATDNGCEVDPSGRCLPRPSYATDNGCQVDPNGRCRK
ncbi:MAG TPA: hypothetical protein VGS07_02950 [Thermoanaerobaculia bacterium]|jgi:hypothetical protein|nr:hypothetical protein [Thermoanaerobaculia bacterium]